MNSRRTECLRYRGRGRRSCAHRGRWAKSRVVVLDQLARGLAVGAKEIVRILIWEGRVAAKYRVGRQIGLSQRKTSLILRRTCELCRSLCGQNQEQEDQLIPARACQRGGPISHSRHSSSETCPFVLLSKSPYRHCSADPVKAAGFLDLVDCQVCLKDNQSPGTIKRLR